MNNLFIRSSHTRYTDCFASERKFTASIFMMFDPPPLYFCHRTAVAPMTHHWLVTFSNCVGFGRMWLLTPVFVFADFWKQAPKPPRWEILFFLLQYDLFVNEPFSTNEVEHGIGNFRGYANDHKCAHTSSWTGAIHLMETIWWIYGPCFSFN